MLAVEGVAFPLMGALVQQEALAGQEEEAMGLLLKMVMALLVLLILALAEVEVEVALLRHKAGLVGQV